MSLPIGLARQTVRFQVADRRLLHPLIEDGQKLMPGVTRVYRKDQTLCVYAELYAAGGLANQQPPRVSARRNSIAVKYAVLKAKLYK